MNSGLFAGVTVIYAVAALMFFAEISEPHDTRADRMAVGTMSALWPLTAAIVVAMSLFRAAKWLHELKRARRGGVR